MMGRRTEEHIWCAIPPDVHGRSSSKKYRFTLTPDPSFTRTRPALYLTIDLLPYCPRTTLPTMATYNDTILCQVSQSHPTQCPLWTSSSLASPASLPPSNSFKLTTRTAMLACFVSAGCSCSWADMPTIT